MIWLAVILATMASPSPAIEPGRMQCLYPDGSAQVLVIDSAREFAGAVIYRVGDERSVTTRDCMFNVGQAAEQPSWGNNLGRALITCDGPDGLPVYTELASHAAIRSGVWVWREEETGDRYLSTAPCIAEPAW